MADGPISLLRGAAGPCGNMPHPPHLISLLNRHPTNFLEASRAQMETQV